MAQTIPTLLRLPNVLAARGVRKTQHYEDIKKGLFPHPIKIGPRASAWPSHEVAAINAARIVGKSEEAIRRLVADLEAARTADAEA
jgi:prophage regulatory protein